MYHKSGQNRDTFVAVDRPWLLKGMALRRKTKTIGLAKLGMLPATIFSGCCGTVPRVVVNSSGSDGGDMPVGFSATMDTVYVVLGVRQVGPDMSNGLDASGMQSSYGSSRSWLSSGEPPGPRVSHTGEAQSGPPCRMR